MLAQFLLGFPHTILVPSLCTSTFHFLNFPVLSSTILTKTGEAEEKKRALKKDIQSQLRVALQNANDTDDKNAIVMRFLS